MKSIFVSKLLQEEKVVQQGLKYVALYYNLAMMRNITGS